MRILALAIGVLAIALLLFLVRDSTPGTSDVSVPAVRDARVVASPPTATVTPARRSRLAEEALMRQLLLPPDMLLGVRDIVGGLAQAPDHYELTSEGGPVAMNLRGGPAVGVSLGARLPGPEQTIVGTVVDRNGVPVEGAVVLVSSSSPMRVQWAYFGSAAGAVTNRDGVFEIAHAPAGNLLVMGFCAKGWSMPVQANAVRLVLTVARGRLEGRMTYDGHGDSFSLTLESYDKQLLVSDETRSDGTFVIDALPPGMYELRYGLAQVMTGGASILGRKPIVIEDGKTLRVDLAQQAAAIVVASAVPSDRGVALETADYFLFTGDGVGDRKAARARALVEQSPNLMFGGADANAPVQFHDVSPGHYTVCVAGDRDAWWGCAPVTVIDTDDVREVAIPLVRVP